MDIIHQHIFSVKLGHENIEVKSSFKRPRADILIKYNGRNLAILELKKPIHVLTDNDRTQGLSYARLLDPIAPLVIVSNGKETKFYNTYTGEEMEDTSVDRKRLQEILTQAHQLADSSLDDAVKVLLGKDPEILGKIVDGINEKSFNDQIGPINDYTKAIAEEFHLPRKVTAHIINYAKNNAVVAVTGDPLVGKTNILYEICKEKREGLIPIYINAEDCQFGVLQHLANQFMKHFKVITKDAVRQWLIHSMLSKPHEGGKIVLIIDSVRLTDERVIEDINELIELSSDNSAFSLIISCDNSNYTKLAFREGRPGIKTLFGRKALRVEVNRLDEDEFNSVQEMLWDNWSIRYLQGAIRAKELREPRILRVSVSKHIKKRRENTSILISGFLPFEGYTWILNDYNNQPFFIEDMVKLAQTFMRQKPSTALEVMVTYGNGYVAFNKATEELGEQSINRLREQGHIDWYVDAKNNHYIAPKTPEIFAGAAVEALYRTVRDLEFEDAIDYLLKRSEKLPYGDLIAANVIYRLGTKDNFSLLKCIYILLNSPPLVERVTTKEDGKVYSVYFEGKGLVDIPDYLLGEGKMFSNLHPWLVLSQLATIPFEVTVEKDNDVVSADPFSLYRHLLITVGSYREMLRRVEETDTTTEGFMYKTHTLKSKDGEEGEVLCGVEGIIEPITYAMTIGFLILPVELIKVCKTAVQMQDNFLSHRLQNAARNLVDIDDEEISISAKQALKILEAVKMTN
ncbi:type I restriction enzyme HsdR N-terminal domain-containing protein [Lysinibacillus sphaericus]|uniref:type I restriction enzyme HsdR N-terminal domain-containing protein n=1 Tax=Lysinibacillus sphaericus TaxID=1421 RepID=UPI0005664D28|nr:type I restriction enzyme HsdR N-terminal domain-containing protein [Lysinibacillus sphaericus]